MAGTNLATIGNGTSITFPAATDKAFPTVQGGAIRHVLRVDQNAAGNINCKLLRLRFAVLCTSAVNSTANVSILYNTGNNTNLTTFTGDLTLLTGSVTLVGVQTFIVQLTVDLVWESISQIIYGIGSVTAGNTYTQLTQFTNSATSSLANLAFCPVCNFSSINAGNTAQLLTFELDQY